MGDTGEMAVPEGWMTREQYHAWTERQPRGRFERIDGEIVAMAPERVTHLRVKARVLRGLENAIAATSVRCEALADGLTVRVGDHTDFEPDATVNRGEPMGGDLTFATEPVIVVELVSTSTGWKNGGVKLMRYFDVASIRPYLLVYPKQKAVVHHRRTAGGIATAIVSAKPLSLDPPGITVDVRAFFPDW